MHHGIISLISAYIPHSGYEFEDRQSCFTELFEAVRPTTPYSTTLVLGDFNAKLLQQQPGEEQHVGQFVYLAGAIPASTRKITNRQLLLELCVAADMSIANTFFDTPPNQRITYRNLGVEPMGTIITPDKFSQIDHVLCHMSVLPWVKHCQTHQAEALRSQHYLTTVDFALQFQTQPPLQRRRLDISSVREPGIEEKFTSSFYDAWKAAPVSHGTLDELANRVEHAFSTASTTLRTRQQPANKPWISQSTLDMIEQRNAARQSGDADREQILNTTIRENARADRTN